MKVRNFILPVATRSLRTQILLAVSALLLLFFGLTIFVLDNVFRDLSERALHGRLEAQLLALVAAADEEQEGLRPDKQLLEVRYNNPGSGLYGEITVAGVNTWRSASLLATGVQFQAPLHPGQQQFSIRTGVRQMQVMALSKSVSWEFKNGVTHSVVFNVAESLQPYYAQLSRFRIQLFTWFAGLTILLIGALTYVLRTVLKPLRRIEQEIDAIEVGQATELSTTYPRELIGITANMNTLLRTERERLSRYRNTLGNLAHSLKTPLAVMRSLLNEHPHPALDELLSRMDNIVRYQLKRAASSAGSTLGAPPVPVLELLEPLRAALLKVYVARHIDCQMNINPECRFFGDAGDLLEIVGNVLENAFKYCRHNVRCRVQSLKSPDAKRPGLQFTIEDDGPGIAADQRQQVLERGVRLDEQNSGQGIGLAVVNELVKLYQGQVVISESTLGGACVTVKLSGPV